MSQAALFRAVANDECGAPGHPTSGFDLAGHCSMLLGNIWGRQTVRPPKVS
jgi:hypothetical protein